MNRKINWNAGTLATPAPPVIAAAEELRRQLIEFPTDFCIRKLPGLLDAARLALAGFLNARPADLLLLRNVTVAMNIVTTSIRFEPGDELLTTDHEYGAVDHCWDRCARATGLVIRRVPLDPTTDDPKLVVERLVGAIGPRTRVLSICHVTSPTGFVMPVAELCREARNRGILSVIDGAHGPGMVPVDVQAIGADFYGANCHKWLRAPAGAGFLHVRESCKPMLRSPLTSWGYSPDGPVDDEPSPLGGTRWQAQFEFWGTDDRISQLVIPQVLDHRRAEGGEEQLRERRSRLLRSVIAQMEEAGFVTVTPPSQRDLTAMAAFAVPKCDRVSVWNRLWNEFGIECPVTEAAGRHFLRVSCSVERNEGEIPPLVQAAKAVFDT
jgi:isopenicillin-N epimerase